MKQPKHLSRRSYLVAWTTVTHSCTVCPTASSEKFSRSRMPLLGFSSEPDNTNISRQFCANCIGFLVQRRINFKLARFVFSSPSGYTTPYLADDIDLVSEGPRWQLLSSDNRSHFVPCTHNIFGDKSFTVAGPRIWNSLPAYLCDEDITYSSFRRELKAF